MDAYTDRVDMSSNPVFGLRNGDFGKIFATNGNVFSIDFYHGYKVLHDNRIGTRIKAPAIISFWCDEINGKEQDPPVQIVMSVDHIIAVETMNAEPEDD
tara:strand:- start:1505 stop:1801 length:297 start_codon:yes stop_codon:yes gene_type:complete